MPCVATTPSVLHSAFASPAALTPFAFHERAPLSDERAPLSDERAPPSESEGERAVRRALVSHLPRLVGHARRLTQNGDDGDDLVQATVVRALSFANTFVPGTNVGAWLHRVLESVFLSGCRRRTRERRALAALDADPCAWVRREHAPSMSELSPPVEAALSKLPPCFGEVVRLVDVQELSYRDAAIRLEVPLGTIMSRLHRGRRLLARALSDGTFEVENAAAPVLSMAPGITAASAVEPDESAPPRADAA
jgi:RNA polymerase sigma-70 factor, ECF subfamily